MPMLYMQNQTFGFYDICSKGKKNKFLGKMQTEKYNELEQSTYWLQSRLSKTKTQAYDFVTHKKIDINLIRKEWKDTILSWRYS